jgi:hypothetical protein
MSESGIAAALKAHARHNGRCACCGKVTQSVHTDHDHATGAFRGLICPPCNKAIGSFADDPRLLNAAARYLQRSR